MINVPHSIGGDFWFRYSISWSAIGWMLQTDEDFFLKDTRDECVSLKDRLSAKARIEYDQAVAENEKELNGETK